MIRVNLNSLFETNKGRKENALFHNDILKESYEFTS